MNQTVVTIGQHFSHAWSVSMSHLICLSKNFPKKMHYLTRILQKFSITMLLQFLQNCLGWRVHVNIIAKEGILDYVLGCYQLAMKVRPKVSFEKLPSSPQYSHHHLYFKLQK